MFDALKPGDVLEVQFPVPEQSITRTAHAGKTDAAIFTIDMRGNTAVGVSPQDQSPGSYPMYRRDHMKRSKAPLKEVQRFVASSLPRW